RPASRASDARFARRGASKVRSCQAARARCKRMAAVAIVGSWGAYSASLCSPSQRPGAPARLTCAPLEVRAGARVVLPGVGAAGDAMHRLTDLGLAALLPTLTQPVLGICLGMQ